MSAIASNSIHLQLKQQTSSAHTALDSSPLLAKLMSKNLSKAHYVKVLQKLQPWYFALESVFTECLILPPSLNICSKSALLNEDLQTLSANTQSASFIDEYFGDLTLRFAQQSKEYLLGALYVVEGSSLGGAVLAPKIERTLGISCGTAFYRCYGDNKQALFAQVLAFIQGKIANQQQLDEAIKGANAAFDSLQKWLEM